MATQTVALTKSQIIAALQSAALSQAGVDPATAGLTVNVRIVHELDDPPHVAYPKASVTITVP